MTPRTINRAIFPLHFCLGLSHTDPDRTAAALGMVVMMVMVMMLMMAVVVFMAVILDSCALKQKHNSGHQAIPRGGWPSLRVIEVSQVPGCEAIIL